MKIVEVKPEFQNTTDEQIDGALADPSTDNPIAHEIARLIEGYTMNLVEFVENQGHLPESILRKKGSCPIEERAMQLVLNEFKNLED